MPSQGISAERTHFWQKQNRRTQRKQTQSQRINSPKRKSQWCFGPLSRNNRSAKRPFFLTKCRPLKPPSPMPLTPFLWIPPPPPPATASTNHLFLLLVLNLPPCDPDEHASKWKTGAKIVKFSFLCTSSGAKNLKFSLFCTQNMWNFHFICTYKMCYFHVQLFLHTEGLVDIEGVILHKKPQTLHFLSLFFELKESNVCSHCLLVWFWGVKSASPKKWNNEEWRCWKWSLIWGPVDGLGPPTGARWGQPPVGPGQPEVQRCPGPGFGGLVLPTC